VNNEAYIDILRHLWGCGQKETPREMESQHLVLLPDNAVAHRSVSVKGFLAKNKVTTLKHPPYSSGLVPSNVYLFPRLKSALKGRSFCDATDINKN
jgi:hypothetical protein